MHYISENVDHKFHWAAIRFAGSNVLLTQTEIYTVILQSPRLCGRPRVTLQTGSRDRVELIDMLIDWVDK